jgi:hypothetical protein
LPKFTSKIVNQAKALRLNLKEGLTAVLAALAELVLVCLFVLGFVAFTGCVWKSHRAS